MKSIEEEMDAWVHGLLVSDEALPKAPAELYAQVLRTALRRSQRIAYGFTISAAAALLATVLFWPGVTRLDKRRQVVTAIGRSSRSARREIVEERLPENRVATFVGQSDLIVVPIESNDPAVTIVQVYPTSLAQKSWHRKAIFQAVLSQSHLKPTNPVRGR